MRRRGGHLGVVERRSDLDDVHGGELDAPDDLADRAPQLAGEHAAGFGRASSGCHAGIDDIDVH
ncbi:hypothetical protein BH23CHL10_BH23CHL10_16580 [soil metagenome]